MNLPYGADPDEERLLDQSADDIVAADEDEGGDAEVVVDEDDETDDTADLGEDLIGQAPAQPPEGYMYVNAAPPLESDEDKLKLVGRFIMHAFHTDTFRGWLMGKITARGVSNRDLQKTPTANFVVTYDKRRTKQRSLDGRVASTLLASNYGPCEWWILLDQA